jgi:hypothetical protein
MRRTQRLPQRLIRWIGLVLFWRHFEQRLPKSIRLGQAPSWLSFEAFRMEQGPPRALRDGDLITAIDGLLVN